MAESAPHIQDCPACQAESLTEADRQHLREHGWTEPRHITAPKPQMAEPPPVNDGARVGMVVVALTIWAAFAANLPITTAILTPIVLVAVIALWWNHRTSHRAAVVDGCTMCEPRRRRDARQHWAHYQRLVRLDKQRRANEAHASNYERLRELEAEQEALREELRRYRA